MCEIHLCGNPETSPEILDVLDQCREFINDYPFDCMPKEARVYFNGFVVDFGVFYLNVKPSGKVSLNLKGDVYIDSGRTEGSFDIDWEPSDPYIDYGNWIIDLEGRVAHRRHVCYGTYVWDIYSEGGDNYSYYKKVGVKDIEKEMC